MNKIIKYSLISSLIFSTGFIIGRLAKRTTKISYGGEIVINIYDDKPADVYLAVKDQKVLEENDAVYLKIKKLKSHNKQSL